MTGEQTLMRQIANRVSRVTTLSPSEVWHIVASLRGYEVHPVHWGRVTAWIVGRAATFHIDPLELASSLLQVHGAQIVAAHQEARRP